MMATVASGPITTAAANATAPTALTAMPPQQLPLFAKLARLDGAALCIQLAAPASTSA